MKRGRSVGVGAYVNLSCADATSRSLLLRVVRAAQVAVGVAPVDPCRVGDARIPRRRGGRWRGQLQRGTVSLEWAEAPVLAGGADRILGAHLESGQKVPRLVETAVPSVDGLALGREPHAVSCVARIAVFHQQHRRPDAVVARLGLLG